MWFAWVWQMDLTKFFSSAIQALSESLVALQVRDKKPNFSFFYIFRAWWTGCAPLCVVPTGLDHALIH
jgi:hypothetical protein